MPLNIKPQEQLKPNDTLARILQEALGSVLALDSAPTTADGQLQEKQIGYNSTNLYITLGGTTYRISMTAV